MTSDSSPVRSSASTWIATRNSEPSRGDQCTVTTRSGWDSSRWPRLTQSARCTETPLPAGDEAGDRVAGHRGAALGQPGPDVGGALDHHTGVAGRAAASAAGSGSVVSARSSCAPAMPPADLTSLATTDWALTCPSPTAAYSAGQVRRSAARARCTEQRVGGGQPLQRQALLAHGPGDRRLARLGGGLPALLGEPVPDLVPGPGALDEPQPVPARRGVRRLGGEDLHGVAVVQRALQRAPGGR